MGKFKWLYKAFDRPSAALIWSATAIGLLIQLTVFAVIAYDTYRDTLDSNFQVAENIASLIERDIARNIELYDLSLQAVAERIGDHDVMALPPRLKRMTVFDRSATAPGLGAMVVLDKEGSIVLDSLSDLPRKGNFADREYFKFQRDTPAGNGFYISRPFQARLQNGTWSVSISRRLNSPAGDFSGIVSGTLRLDFIQARMEAAALGKRGIASLLRDDGIVFAQSVAGNPNVGADWSFAQVLKLAPKAVAGIYFGEGAVDRVPRLYAFKNVSGFPLIVVAGVSRSDVLAPWWFKVQLISAVFAAMVLSVVVLVAMFSRELRRRIGAERGQAALARQDRLSQLANRLGFDEALTLAWRRAGREGQPLSLLMIDVDNFKEFNDRYGHPEGDRVLTAIAAAIGAAIRRPGDLAARYGGEEFAVLLPNTGSEGAMRIAESIRNTVLAAAVPHEGSSHGFVTVSLGAATIIPSNGMTQVTLVESADRALYAAKADGRNKSCLDVAAFISRKDPAQLRA